MQGRPIPPPPKGARFHVMAKPVGAACNLRCRTCYYLHKTELLGARAGQRMSEDVIEAYIRQNIEGQDYSEIVFSWQGGEPSLMGLDFYRHAVALQKKYCPPNKRIHNDFQTNGTLITDEWCEFFAQHDFLVGLSIDGPKQLHDPFRPDASGRGTWDAVRATAERLKKHGVKWNTLTCIHAGNARRPLDVYRFLRRELGSTRMQFIPIVEPKNFERQAPGNCPATAASVPGTMESVPRLGTPASVPGTIESVVTDWSVAPDDWAYFMCKVFDEWHARDIGKVYVYYFESAVAQWMGLPAGMCTMSPVCGKALALEHDGSLYSCDHFVYPEYRLGSVLERPLHEMIFSPRQEKFGLDKSARLPRRCRECPWLFACHGECPKNRIIATPDGEPGLNYLCEGWRTYFAHIDGRIRDLARRLDRPVLQNYLRGEM
ncbi:MAG: anaerobic sulfatase maturase [Kiritimatiellae bacterium]|nr:anaerobic sulfatase maturase [Kiritimatiellia bacterium]